MVSSARNLLSKLSARKESNPLNSADRLGSDEDYQPASQASSRSARKSAKKMREKNLDLVLGSDAGTSGNASGKGLGSSLFSQREQVIRLSKEEIEEQKIRMEAT